MTTDTRATASPTERATRAWEDGMRAMFGGYGRQTAQLAAGFWGLRIDPDQVSRSLERITAATRELGTAQWSIVQEWLQAPYWLTGVSSPRGLAASYSRLWEAQTQLFSAYLAALVPAQEAATQVGRRATQTTRDIIETQARTAAVVAQDVAEAQQATSEAVAATNRRTSRATTHAMEQALEVAEEAATRAASQAERTADAVAGAAERSGGAAAPNGRVIKGTVSRDGEKIYHIPGQSSYERTQPDALFSSEEEAQAAGYRRAHTPGGGRIKGNVSRDGEKIYHLPGQANYDRIDAEALFETEEEAQAAGFRPSQR